MHTVDTFMCRHRIIQILHSYICTCTWYKHYTHRHNTMHIHTIQICTLGCVKANVPDANNYLSWNSLTTDTKNGTLPGRQKIYWTRPKGIWWIMYLMKKVLQQYFLNMFYLLCHVEAIMQTVLVLRGGVMEPGKGGWQVPYAVANISFRFHLDALQTSLYVLRSSFTSSRWTLATSIIWR